MQLLNDDPAIETLIVRVSGRVQGVGFRAAAVRQAHFYGVRGWVRNLENGMVEALVQGSPEQVDHMLSWFHAGPPGARVSQVNHEICTATRRFDRFEIH